MITLHKKVKVNQDKCFVCDNPVKLSYHLTNLDCRKEWKQVSYYLPILHCSVCDKGIWASEYVEIEDEAIEIAKGKSQWTTLWKRKDKIT